MVIPWGKVSPSIAAPPFASINVPVPVSSGNSCSVSAIKPPDPDANTVSSMNWIATNTPDPAPHVTAVVPVTNIEPAWPRAAFVLLQHHIV